MLVRNADHSKKLPQVVLTDIEIMTMFIPVGSAGLRECKKHRALVPRRFFLELPEAFSHLGTGGRQLSS